MIKIAVLLVVVASVNAGLLVRTPQHDSAVIHSERLGGNFAYSSVEGHAYAHINPIIETVRSPVAVTVEQQHVNVPVIKEHTIAYNTPVVAAAPSLIASPSYVIAK